MKTKYTSIAATFAELARKLTRPLFGAHLSVAVSVLDPLADGTIPAPRATAFLFNEPGDAGELNRLCSRVANLTHVNATFRIKAKTVLPCRACNGIIRAGNLYAQFALADGGPLYPSHAEDFLALAFAKTLERLPAEPERLSLQSPPTRIPVPGLQAWWPIDEREHFDSVVRNEKWRDAHDRLIGAAAELANAGGHAAVSV